MISNQEKLLRLRIELWTAAQTLEGADMEEFAKLISEIASVLRLQL